MEPTSYKTIILRSVRSITNLPFLLLDTALNNGDSAFHYSSGISTKNYLLSQEMKNPKMRLKLIPTQQKLGFFLSLSYQRLHARRKGEVSVTGWQFQLALNLLGVKGV